MKELSRDLKYKIILEVLNQDDPFGEKGYFGLMTFLNEFIDLRNLPSTVVNYKNLYKEIEEKAGTIWDYDTIFRSKLGLLEDNLIFEKFLSVLLSPKIRKNLDGIKKYYYLIEPFLNKEDAFFVLVRHTDEMLPIYEIGYIENDDGVNEIKEPQPVAKPIGFYVTKSQFGHYKNASNTNITTPFFNLVHQPDIDDNGIYSSYELFYYSDWKKVVFIGMVKIIHTDVKDTSLVLPEEFTQLGSEFCSLGQDLEYYSKLKECLGIDFEPVLWRLRDAAFYVIIQEEYEHNTNFKSSLIRFDQPERLLREAKYRVYNYDLSNVYSFTYDFKPKFAVNNLEIKFNFQDNENTYNRLFAIIGKNGSGKTQLISSLPNDIYRRNNKVFTPARPLFSKVIAVSYNVFDSFEIPKKTNSFNYLYCGLKDEKGESLSDRGLLMRFHNTRKKIFKLNRSEQWISILKKFVDQRLVTKFIYQKEVESDITDYVFDLEKFGKVRNQLSSGQSIALYILTEIVANIRYDSIILFDEPETHLHPNAITNLVKTIYELLNQFESYCIMATHSPIIIRELLSKNVFVIERDGDFSSIRKIGIESFGESISVLTDEVFGNRQIEKQYKLTIEELVEKGYSYEELLNHLQSNNVPLSLTVRAYMKNLLYEKS